MMFVGRDLNVFAVSCLTMFALGPLADGQTYLYCANGGGQDVSGFSINPLTGVLTPTPKRSYPAAGIAEGIAVDPSGRFAYVSNANTANVSAYAIDAATGDLISLPTPTYPVGSSPHGIAIDPSGKFAVIENFGDSTLTEYSINVANGSLTPTGRAVPSGPGPAFNLAFHPNGLFLYESDLNGGGPGSVTTYSFNPSNGSLSHIGSTASGTEAAWVAMDPLGRFAYVSNGGASQTSIYGFNVDSSTGSLSATLGSPYLAGEGRGLAIDPLGRFLFMANEQNRTVSVFAISQTTGALTPQGLPYSTGGDTALIVDPSGNFLYVASVDRGAVFGYRINQSTGALTAIPGSPFPAGAEPLYFAIATPQNRSALAIDFFQPLHGGNTGKVTIQIVGSGFQSGVTVKLTGIGPEIVGTTLTDSDASLISATFDLTELSPGSRDLVITNPNKTSLTIPAAFTIDDGGSVDLWVDIIGRNLIRSGFDQTYYVQYGNRGNIDSKPTIISAEVPSSVSAISADNDLLIGSKTNGTNTTLAFALPYIAAGSTGVIPVTLNTSSNTQNKVMENAQERLQAIAATQTSTFQFGAFLNLLLDLSPSSPSDFSSAVGCSVYPVCLSQCSSKYLRQLQYESLAESQFETYANDSAGAGAALARGASKRVAIGASVAVLSYLADFILPEIGVTSEGGVLAQLVKDLSGSAITHVVAATTAAYTGSERNNTEELASALLAVGTGIAKTDSLLAMLIQGNAPADAVAKVHTIGSLFEGLQAAIEGMSADFDQYFQEELQRSNDFNAFKVGAANFCRAVNDTAQCVLSQGAHGTPCGSHPQPPSLPPQGDDRRIITIQPVQSLDPNDKAGPVGTDAQRYISGRDALAYLISFANEQTASAPAQQVVVTDPLNNHLLDLASLTLGPIQFGETLITPPSFRSTFSTSVDLRPKTNLLVDISAAVDKTGVLSWTFRSIDPKTGQAPTDPTAGFLPPGAGGSVAFTINPKGSIPDATSVSNRALIVFDVNPPIETPIWSNIFDSAVPKSTVHMLSSTQATSDFTVNWSGEVRESSIRGYSIYVSDNGGTFLGWLTNTTATNSVFSGIPGHTYAFYSEATDMVGNVEPPKDSGEAATTILQTACGADETQQVAIVEGGLRRNNATGRFVQSVTLTNVSASSLQRVSLVLDSLSSNARLYGAAGTTTDCSQQGGSPYIGIDSLKSGETATITLEFTDPGNTAISYTPRIVAGSGGR